MHSPSEARSPTADFGDATAAFDLVRMLLTFAEKEFRREKPAAGPVGTAPLENVGLDRVLREVAALLHTTEDIHSRSNFSLFTSPPTPIAVFADALASLVDANCAAYGIGSELHRIERTLLSTFSSRLGVESAEGHFVPGGSLGNLQCLFALATRAPRDRSKLVVLGSEYSHFSIKRAARLLGSGTIFLPVASDAVGAMDVASLVDAIRRVQSDGGAAIVVSTYGFPTCGSIDRLNEIAEACRSLGSLHHLDAAYGGPALMLSSRIEHAKAVRKVDTICIDFHKWWRVSNPLTLVMSCHQGLLADAFAVDGYMPVAAHGAVPYQQGLLTTRRASFLQLWMNLCGYGLEFFLEHTEGCIQSARTLERLLDGPSVEVLQQAQMSVVCCRPRRRSKGDVARVARAIVERGWPVSTVKIGGDEWIRICITQAPRNDAELLGLEEVIRSCVEEPKQFGSGHALSM